MLKLLGALCVMLGALCCGLRGVEGLRRRRDVLEELRASLVFLAEELSFHLTPLPQLLERLGRERKGSVGAFFRQVLATLERDPEGGVRLGWRQGMTKHLTMLKEEERQVLVEVGRTLGRYDAATQQQVLLQAAQRLGAFRDQARCEAQRLGRVYVSVSAAGGAALVLMLV